MRRPMLAALAFSAIIGVCSSLVIPESEASNFKFAFNPPTRVEGQSALLTTRWHGDTNTALDWDDDESTPDRGAYLRGFGSYWDNATATVYLYSEQWGNCLNSTRADIHGPGGGYVGTYWFVHTNKGSKNLSSIPLSAAGAWSNIYVGETSTWDSCTWAGSHVHEEQGTTSRAGITGSGTWARNTGLYPYGGSPNTAHKNNLASKWTRSLSW